MTPSYAVISRRSRTGLNGISLSLWLGFLAWAFATSFWASADDLPRYRLRVGQEISYTSKTKFNYGTSSIDHNQELRFWITQKNPDGSWHVIVKLSQVQEKQKPLEQLAEFDLFDDGRIPTNLSLAFRSAPNAFFVRLPKDDVELKSGWETLDEAKGERRVFKPSADSSADKLIIDIDIKNPESEIYLTSSQLKSTFDRQQGIVTRATTSNSQKYGINGTGTGKIDLKFVKFQTPDWMKEFAREAAIYFAANERYEKLIAASQKDVEHATGLIKQAEEALAATRKELKNPELTKQLDQQISEHSSMASYYTTSAERIAKVVGKPAFDFATTDLDSKPQALKDFQGKVVILDFWYRGCGWCIRAMPQVKQVVKTFDGQPVLVLGMNTDEVEEDARFVIDKMQLNYATLKAKGLPEKFEVNGFPTLIIIDQKGIIRDVHVGYSPTLADDVTASVRKLLGQQ